MKQKTYCRVVGRECGFYELLTLALTLFECTKYLRIKVVFPKWISLIEPKAKTCLLFPSFSYFKMHSGVTSICVYNHKEKGVVTAHNHASAKHEQD